MRMYDYTHQFVELERMLEGGEIEQEGYQGTLKSIEGDADEKAENLSKMIDNFNAQAEMLKNEEDRLKKKRKTLENSVEWLTNSLELYLKALKKDTHQVGMYKLWYKKLPDVVEFTNEKVIPKAYKTTETITKISKKDIAKALKDGETVKGATLVTNRRKFEVKK